MRPGARPEEAATRLQGLQLRPGRAAAGRGRGAEAEGDAGPAGAQAAVGGPERAGLHGQGQDGLLQQLLPRRRVPVCRVPVPGPAGLQARRGGQDSQRGAAVKGTSKRRTMCGTSQNKDIRVGPCTDLTARRCARALGSSACFLVRTMCGKGATRHRGRGGTWDGGRGLLVRWAAGQSYGIGAVGCWRIDCVW